MANAKRDDNYITTLLGVSSSDGSTPVDVYTDPTTHRLLVNATITGSASDGAIVDGSNSAIKATVLDLTSSNPLTVGIVDSNGDQITSFGGGTQYTEDAAAAANPVGTALMLVREDGRAGSLTNTDGDNVAARGNNKGELYVIDTDANAKLTTIDGRVDGIEGLLTTIDADTGNISTKIDTLAGAVAGSEMQVDVLTMPTVTVNAHAVTNAGTFVVQENGAALTALQLLDDTVQVLGTDTYTETTSKGLTIGAVRRDADTTLVGTTNEFGPLQMDANGRLKVEVFSGETLPVSLTSTTITGTVAVTQSGTWDEVGINDSGNSITVDNGGTFATQVDGAALTALQLIDDPVATLGTTTYTETTTKGMIIGAVRRDADTTLVDTTNEVAPLQVNAGGQLKVAVIAALPAGTANIGDVDVASIAAGDNNIGNVDIVTLPGDVEADIDQIRDQIDLITPDIEEIRVDADAIRVATELIDDVVYVDDTATHATGTSKGVLFMAAAAPTDTAVNANDIGAVGMTANRELYVSLITALPAGTAAIGKLAANSGVDIGDVDVTSISAGSNVIGDVGLAPRTSGGMTIHRSLDLDESEEEVKATAGQVYGLWFTNTATTTRWLKFYNDTAANVSVGTTTPVITIGLPGNTSDDISGALFGGGLGIPFSTAICAAATTGVADADTGAPAANDVVVNIFFK